MRQARNPDGIHAPLGAYVHQIELAADERLLVLSGQVGMTPDGRVPDDPVAQVDVALTNLEINLRAAGMDVADLAKITFYLVGEVELDGVAPGGGGAPGRPPPRDDAALRRPARHPGAAGGGRRLGQRPGRLRQGSRGRHGRYPRCHVP
jgi:hypothetical protein